MSNSSDIPQDPSPASDAEQAEFSRAFALWCDVDEARDNAARFRVAADSTTGSEYGENIRHAVEAEAEVARIEAELTVSKSSDKKGCVSAKPVTGGNVRKRQDDIAIEIDVVATDIEQQGKRATAANVMPLLQARAGRQNSPISEVFEGGLIWKRGTSGAPERLTLTTLKDRLKRRKGR